MTDLTIVTTDTVEAPAKAILKPTEPEAGGFAAPSASVEKARKKRSKPSDNARRQTKASKVERLLARKAGATVEQISAATGWQPHTCRAFMSGLRKKGWEILRETGKGGMSVYRFGSGVAPAEAN